MVMEVVQALCKCSIHVSQQNHSELALKAVTYLLKQCYRKKAIFVLPKISMSAKAKVYYLLVTLPHQLLEQMIHRICAAMEVHVYGAQ